MTQRIATQLETGAQYAGWRRSRPRSTTRERISSSKRRTVSMRVHTQRPTSCSTKCSRSTCAVSTRTHCSASATSRAGPHSPRHHFELGVAIGSLTVGEDFDGVLPWGLVDNRSFLRCLHGLSRTLLRCDRREDAAAALRRLLRLDPADPLGAGATLAAIEAGKPLRDLEMAP